MIFLFIILQLPGFTQFHIPETDSISKDIPFKNEQKCTVELDISSFILKLKKIDTSNESFLLNTKIKYDSISVVPIMEYQRKERIGTFSIQEEKRKKGGIFGFKNVCNIALTSKIPLYLDLISGASNIDLSKLKIAKLNLKTTGKSILRFDSPNTVKCEELCISVQFGSFRGEHLGNANFDIFHFHGGIGLYTLDFRGEFNDSRRIEITMGGGSLKLILPKEVGIRLKPSGISFRNIERESLLPKDNNGWYESKNWNIAKNKLIIHIDSSFGVLKVGFL